MSEPSEPTEPSEPSREPPWIPLSPLPPTPDPPPSGWNQNYSHLYRRQGNFLARIASTLEAGGIDHVLWGHACFKLHGLTTDERGLYHFIVPDDKIGRACALLLAAGAVACRGQSWCAVHKPSARSKALHKYQRPAQHVHEKCAGFLAWVCLHKHSKVLLKVPSLELTVPPPAGSPPSAWGVVSADVYRPFFFGWVRGYERPSLHPLRLLPPHKLCEAFMALMCRAEMHSDEHGFWLDQTLTVLCDYYRPREWQEACELGQMMNSICTIDATLMAPAYRRWVHRVDTYAMSYVDAENELRRAEGLPLGEPRRAGNLPPLALGGDEEEYEGLQQKEEEEEAKRLARHE